MKTLAVGSPKGGVGKTSSAVTLATIAARDLGLSVLLIDADENRSALDWVSRAGDLIPVDVAPGTPDEVRRIRRGSGYDLVIVDLPGAREGAFAAVLGGDGDGPVCDYLLVPTRRGGDGPAAGRARRAHRGGAAGVALCPRPDARGHRGDTSRS